MHKVISEAMAAGRSLFESEAWELFSAYGIPTPRCRVAKSSDEAVAAAQEIGYPVVMKIVSRHILHKSDAGGVKVNIKDDAAARAAYQTILENVRAYKADAEIEGILVCEMLKPGLETIIGMTQDMSFGPTLMFGLGGIFVEVLQDVSFRVLPLDKQNALDMINEINGAALLHGVRGEKPKDIDAMAELLLKVARMIEENPEIKELDINPCFLYEQGVLPADARVMF